MIVNYLITTFILSMGIQLFFFVIAYLNKTDKVTDLSYGLTFIILSLFLLLKGSFDMPRVVLATAIIIWGMRLSGYLFYRIMKIKKDERFDGIRENILSFGSFWLMQGISVFVIMLPSTIFLSKKSLSFNYLMFAGISIWLFGLAIETIADYQKFVFKSQIKNKGRFISSGLWKYSRHPNYFGEMLCWWGLFIYAASWLNNWEWISIIGPLLITVLLLFITGIPPLEKKADAKYGEKKHYVEYKKRTSLLIPLPPKNL